MAKNAAQVAEEVQTDEPQTEATETTTKRAPDLSVEGRLLTNAKQARKHFRNIGGRGDKLEDAEQAVKDARAQVAKSADDPDALDEAIQEMGKAKARVSRLSKTDAKAGSNARASLNEVIRLANEMLSEIPADETAE